MKLLSRNRQTRIVVQVTLASALALACHAPKPEFHGPTLSDAPENRVSPPVATVEGSSTLSGYPPGRWRLAPPGELALTVLWVDHILIRHQGSLPNLASFSVLPLPWTPAPNPPDRSREHALELARQVASLAQAAPEHFGELARTWSEDVTTSEVGGSLGGIRAESLYDWPQVLDALAAVRPGEVSEPVETPFGFHVLRTREPPRAERISGRRIVIGYDQAPWLYTYLAKEGATHRSREDARELTYRLYERVHREPESFMQLLRQYSDHQDVLRDGDFGAWSTVEPTPFPREIDRLMALTVGAVAPPIDSPYGFQIIMRTPLQARPVYSAARIQWHQAAPDSEQPDAGKSEVAAGLQKVANLLKQTPARFAEFQKATCCAGIVDTWEAGRGSAIDEHALAQLRVGEIATVPIQEGPGIYTLLQRLTPRQPQLQTASLALPAPERPDVVYALLATERLDLLQAAQQEAEARLASTGLRPPRLADLHELQMRWKEAQSLDERRDVLSALQKKLADALGADQYARYWSVVEEVFERKLLVAGPAILPW